MITSIHNPHLQRVRELLGRGRSRARDQVCVLEGVRLIGEAWSAGLRPERVFYSNPLNARASALVSSFQEHAVPLEEVEPDLLGRISDTEHTQGLLAILPVPKMEMPQSPDLLVLLDGISDPGNLGTILRTAHAAGVQAVLTSPDCADPFSPKVLRAGMGAHFHVPILSLEWEGITTLLRDLDRKPEIYLSETGANQSVWECDLTRPLVMVISSEARGASAAARALATRTVHIPMPGGSESLNASVAAGILLFEVVRQRNPR